MDEDDVADADVSAFDGVEAGGGGFDEGALVEGDVVGEVEGVAFGHEEVLGVGSGPGVDGADGLEAGAAEVGADEAVVAMAAGDGGVADDAVAGFEVLDLGTDLGDDAGPFVSGGHGEFDRPVLYKRELSGVNGVIRAADTGTNHFAEHITRPGLRRRNIYYPDIICPINPRGFHKILPQSYFNEFIPSSP